MSGCDQRGDALEERAAERLPADRETLALAIREPEPAAAEHLVKDSVLLAEVVDRVLLTAVQESCEDRDGEREGGAGAAHVGELSRLDSLSPMRRGS